MSAPPSAGPTMPTTVLIDAMALVAATRCSRPTSVGMAPKSAASNQTKANAESSATTKMWSTVRAWSHPAAGMLPKRKVLSRSQPTISRRRFNAVSYLSGKQAKQQVGEHFQCRQQRCQQGRGGQTIYQNG